LEIVQKKLESIFNVNEMAVLVNNSIPEDFKVQVAVEQSINKGQTNGIWALKEPIPDLEEFESLVDVQHGRTMIDGKTFLVSEDDTRLVQEDGLDFCTIEDIMCHGETGELDKKLKVALWDECTVTKEEIE
jgi:hypothetical protein